MPCEWVEVDDGRRYIYADCSGGISTEEHFRILERSLELIAAAPDGARLLVHVDPHHRPAPKFLAAVKNQMANEMRRRRVRVAYIGVDGVGRAVIRGLQLVGGGIGGPVFPSRERALAYLFTER